MKLCAGQAAVARGYLPMQLKELRLIFSPWPKAWAVDTNPSQRRYVRVKFMMLLYMAQGPFSTAIPIWRTLWQIAVGYAVVSALLNRGLIDQVDQKGCIQKAPEEEFG